MEPAGDHAVPSGPLAVRWLAYDPGRPRAGALGTARLAFENAGTVPWPPTGERRVCLGYHWLDELGNPIVWDGLWTAPPREVAPGERVEADPAAGRAVALRRPDHSSTAIWSSTRLKSHAPSASETTAATQR